LHELNEKVSHGVILDVFNKLIENSALGVEKNVSDHKFSLFHNELPHNIEEIPARNWQQIGQIASA
tara:strand:+ start:1812 stop:2009 length:198 start_codon:yes stop_codon:yes gene_type:complete